MILHLKYKVSEYNMIFVPFLTITYTATLSQNTADQHSNSNQYSHCLLYGRYGITPTMLLAEEVLHAYAIISNSIMLLFTSLFKNTKILDRTPKQKQK
jgi:hypothetical protein